MDAAIVAAVKIREKEMFIIFFWKTGTWIVSRAGRSSGNVGNRRNNVSRLPWKMWIPDFLLVKRTARIGCFHELESNAPATVPSLHQINPARFVAAVGVVIACKKIAIL